MEVTTFVHRFGGVKKSSTLCDTTKKEHIQPHTVHEVKSDDIRTIKFTQSSRILRLSLEAGKSYMCELQVLVAAGIDSAFYKGTAQILVDDTKAVSLSVPSESIFSEGFMWKWSVEPGIVEFHFESDKNVEFTCKFNVHILSDGSYTVL